MNEPDILSEKVTQLLDEYHLNYDWYQLNK